MKMPKCPALGCSYKLTVPSATLAKKVILHGPFNFTSFSPTVS